MNRRLVLLVLFLALGCAPLLLQAQQRGSSTQGGQAPPTADPYANNPDAGALKFPLAAPAGKDSGALTNVLPGGVNQGRIDEKTWKYGHAFDAPSNSKIWNPVKVKMMKGEKVTGGTVFASSDPSTYCAMANAGYDFIWTEMQHDSRDWENVAKMSRDWTYFPPLGKRSQGGGPAFSPDFWGSVPGGYRNTINDNVVLIEMIETVGGAAQAYEIAEIPGVDAVFAASGDLGNFSGYKQGEPDYERLINVVHDAALAARKRLCGPLAWRDRPDFTCFQAGSETAAINRGVAAELGNLKDTQGKPEVGPYAPKK